MARSATLRQFRGELAAMLALGLWVPVATFTSRRGTRGVEAIRPQTRVGMSWSGIATVATHVNGGAVVLVAAVVAGGVTGRGQAYS